MELKKTAAVVVQKTFLIHYYIKVTESFLSHMKIKVICIIPDVS